MLCLRLVYRSKQGAEDILALFVILLGDLCDRSSGMYHYIVAGNEVIKKLGGDLPAGAGGIYNRSSVCLKTNYSG